MRREERLAFMKILQAHQQTLEICDACATTTRELAAEVARGGVPSTADLLRTVAEAEHVLAELEGVRAEVRRLLEELS